MAKNHVPTQQQIAEAAYHRYLNRGGQPGRDFDDWLEAERELAARTIESVEAVIAQPEAQGSKPRAQGRKLKAEGAPRVPNPKPKGGRSKTP
jgi:hypothetical protein